MQTKVLSEAAIIREKWKNQEVQRYAIKPLKEKFGLSDEDLIVMDKILPIVDSLSSYKTKNDMGYYYRTIVDKINDTYNNDSFGDLKKTTVISGILGIGTGIGVSIHLGMFEHVLVQGILTIGVVSGVLAGAILTTAMYVIELLLRNLKEKIDQSTNKQKFATAYYDSIKFFESKDVYNFFKLTKHQKYLPSPTQFWAKYLSRQEYYDKFIKLEGCFEGYPFYYPSKDDLDSAYSENGSK